MRLFVAGECVCNAEGFDYDTGLPLPPGFAFYVGGPTVEAVSPKTGRVGRLLTGTLVPYNGPVQKPAPCRCRKPN